MAVTKITWENKEGIQNDESIARKNKVMDDDMNEIKQVVNNNADELNTAQSNIENLQSGQGTANTDITNLKSRVSTLETDNTTNKSNIQQLQSKQQETETNVETLQEKVTTLETDNIQNKSDINALKTDNETNKSNISTLQEEQETQNTNIENLQEKDTTQDELIEKLQQENKNIKNALINVETEQAKSLHIEDASTVSAQLSVEGNAEQETQEGTDNLAILENKTYTQNGITIDVKNGEASISGTATVDTTIRIGTAYLVSGKTYYVRKTTNGGGYYLQGTSGAQKWIGDGESSFNPSTTGEWGIYASFATNDNANTKVKFVVSEQSGTAWEEGKVQIPSVNYPSKVKCLGSNKNLFDKNNASIISLNAINQENGTFVTATNQKHVYIECEALTSYSITKSILADTTLGIYETEEIPAVNVNYHQLYLKTASTGIATVKTGKNARYLDIRLNSRALTEEELQEILDTLKIEEGTKATSYSINRTR